MNLPDINQIVQDLKDEFWHRKLAKCKYISKPGIYRLRLIPRKYTYKQVKDKYPVPWAYGQSKLLLHVFGRGFSGRTYGRQAGRPTRRSR